MKATILLGAALVVLSTQNLSAGSARLINIPGREASLRALVFEPVENHKEHPAVIALHGCSGLYMRDGSLNSKQRDWGTRLAAAGFVVVMPDSYGSHGLRPKCHESEQTVGLDKQRLIDLDDALAYLRSRPDIKTDSISLLGWSNGGSAVLQAVQSSSDMSATKHSFAKAIAFYPDCRTALQSGTWHARLPLMILIGGADSWTPASSCLDLVSAASKAGEPVSIKSYPGAVHDFDQPGLERLEPHDLAYTADGSGEASVGTNPEAREDALSVVPAYLAR